ncbi:MAG TPA: antibiotic biosynthesis monooxygenase family protein [Burkholderiaceae bacterium]|nr:antibiotic biosynthesis monooxygenase family protein [Burkholderiaceae bacterium]
MLLLLFEVIPRAGRVDEYLGIAAELRPELDAMGGCLFIDRYRSLAEPRKFLSYQVWRDEAALTRWRVHHAHHKAQALGRVRVFEDYRLRVAMVVRVESMGEPPWQAPHGSTWHDPEGTAPRYVAVAESDAGALDGAEESFESIYRPGEFAHVIAGTAGRPAASLAEFPRARRIRLAEIERDYGMHDRAEAPQYFAPVSSGPPPAS